jgi:hypothetical protein
LNDREVDKLRSESRRDGRIRPSKPSEARPRRRQQSRRRSFHQHHSNGHPLQGHDELYPINVPTLQPFVVGDEQIRVRA